ncbi:integrin alpha FG-GAP repeat-containing protein 2, partial [Dissophora globulifera]
DNAFVIGNLIGELFIFKGNHPEGLPWLTCKGLGTITAVAIGDIRNWGKNSVVVMSAEGLCHIFDIAGLDDEVGQGLPSGINMSPAAAVAGARSGQTPSIYSTTPLQGSYQTSGNSHHQQSGNTQHSNIPATPNIKPVPDIHNHQSYHSNIASSQPHHGTPPPLPSQNTPHGSAASSISGFHHQGSTPNNTPIHSHPGSIHGGNGGGARRGSEAFIGPGSVARTTAALSNLIGTPPTSNASQGLGAASAHRPRSIAANSTTNSPTGTPLLRPQHVSSTSTTPGPGARDNFAKRRQTGSVRHGVVGKSHIRDVGGRRILDKPNLTLPVPVNINRICIADIDGDGLNEIVLARTDRILHSYALQTSKSNSPTTANSSSNRPLSLVKMLSRTSSVSTLESSGLLSPLDDRRETVIHYPSLPPVGRQQYAGSTSAATGAGPKQGSPETQDAGGAGDSSSRLVLVEKKRWALDGQVHCLAVTEDIHTGMPILLVAQPGLKFVMVDHTGNVSEPITQVQRNPSAALNIAGPDTPTRGVGSGDVATEIICGTHYVNGEKKDIIGLMSMDGGFALHDLESNTVKVHDLDSTHKIFGFSKLKFGKDYVGQPGRQPQGKRSRYGPTSSYLPGQDKCDPGDHGDYESDSDDGDTVAETQTLDHAEFSDEGESSRYGRRTGSRRARRPTASMLISDPFGSRFQKDDMFVGCSWSGITYFIDQDFNTTIYEFDARVCAFGAGQYAVTPGRNEPCLFYVDFEDNVYVYHNLYIQTEPTVPFQDIIKADATLMREGRSFSVKESTGNNERGAEDDKVNLGSTDTERNGRERIPTSNSRLDDRLSQASSWPTQDMKAFIHESLYSVNRYEDEYQRLKRLADIERAKRVAFLEAEANKELALREAERRATAAADTLASSRESSMYIDPRLRHHPHGLSVDTNSGLNEGTNRSQNTQERRHDAGREDDDMLSPPSPVSPISLSSPKPRMAYLEKRRSSLLVKDVLSHYEGKITPPLSSPTSPPSVSEQTINQHFSSGSLQAGSKSSATLNNIMKRFSFKDLGNSRRLSRSPSVSGGSGSSGDGDYSPVSQGYPLLGAPVLTKGKSLEARVGKALRVNRPIGVPRNRTLGVAGRKLSARSRLSLQQDREDDAEEGDEDQAPSEDGTADTDGDNLIEFDQSSRKSAGDDDFQPGQEFDNDPAAEEHYNRVRTQEANDGDEYVQGVYTPSTISPIPSPGRFYGNQYASMTEPSASLETSTYLLSKGLLSPSTRPAVRGTTAVTSTAGAVGKSSRQSEQDSSLGSIPSSTPAAPGGSGSHRRQRSGHGLLEASLNHLPSRESTASGGISSGPNSAGHSSVQDGRRSRAESVLSAGSDVGGVMVPDITLLGSSFPIPSSLPYETSEVLEHEEALIDGSEGSGDDTAHTTTAEGHERSLIVLNSGIRRPPRRSATVGSQETMAHGRSGGLGSDTVSGNSGGHLPNRPGVEVRGSTVKGGDVKLMSAPLPRSNQHYQRQQLEQQDSSGNLTGNSKEPSHATSTSHISFVSSTRPGIVGTSGGAEGAGEDAHAGGEGLGRGKSTSTTSSATVSDFGSGPSSPLTSNVTASNAILSYPTSNSFMGFNVLSLPLTSPSVSTASAQQHQYFAASHYHQPSSSMHGTPPASVPPGHLATSSASIRGFTFGHDRALTLDDDRMSIRSRVSTYRGGDDANDISSMLAAASTTSISTLAGDGGSENGLYGLSQAATSSGHLVSDSLVRRLEELQQQDRDMEERQRQKEREMDKEKDKDKGKEKEKPRSRQSSRPTILSRANSGASVQSNVSHHRAPISHPPTSHGSAAGSASASAPVSGGSGTGSGPASGSGRQGWDSEEQHDSTRRLKMRPGLGQGL